MKIYLVGGAIRDKLLNLPIKERDWVVVGATVKDMLDLGYKQVGKEFPVFLHPKTNEEYALARMERKTKPGYKGFAFDTSATVSLEDDLIRRDLTINAMAFDPETQTIIDPWGGKKDLANKVLRHVSPAFAEDPVRILRVGRFLARYAHLGFKVAPDTINLMQSMVANGEIDALVAERVWKELERALTEKNPEQFFIVLANAKALKILFPDLEIESPGMRALIAATDLSDDPHIRFAALFYALPNGKKAVSDVCKRYRLPNAYRELALLTVTHYENALRAEALSAEELLQLFSGLDIFRREDRFKQFLIVVQAIAQSLGLSFEADWLKESARIAKSIDPKILLAQGLEGQEFAQQLKIQRLEKLNTWLQTGKSLR